jgi:hypothetical protein
MIGRPKSADGSRGPAGNGRLQLGPVLTRGIKTKPRAQQAPRARLRRDSAAGRPSASHCIRLVRRVSAPCRRAALTSDRVVVGAWGNAFHVCRAWALAHHLMLLCSSVSLNGEAKQDREWERDTRRPSRRPVSRQMLTSFARLAHNA